jgi:hypothetical protein
MADDAPALLLVSVHHETLMQSLLPVPAPLFDDVDRDFGLHDYTLLLCLRTATQVRFEGRWDKLFARRPARKGDPMCGLPAGGNR